MWTSEAFELPWLSQHDTFHSCKLRNLRWLRQPSPSSSFKLRAIGGMSIAKRKTQVSKASPSQGVSIDLGLCQGDAWIEVHIANGFCLQDEPESPTVEALISPRNSLVMRLAYLDPSMPPSPPRDHNIRHGGNYDSQERRMTKQISRWAQSQQCTSFMTNTFICLVKTPYLLLRNNNFLNIFIIQGLVQIYLKPIFGPPKWPGSKKCLLFNAFPL